MQEHVYNGHIQTLWREEFKTIYQLMIEAQDLMMTELTLECAINLKRYLNRQNVLPYFFQAHQQRMSDWKKECQLFINELNLGLFLPLVEFSEMKVNVLNDDQDTLEHLFLFTPYLTELQLSLTFKDFSFYHQMIARCHYLKGLDISGLDENIAFFEDLPKSLSHFNLSACNWIQASHLRKLNKQFPFISSLALANNGQLNYLAWGELAQFENLIKLDLSRCFQLNDEDIKQITKSLPDLQQLSIEECYQITDKGFLTIAIHCNDLNEMNINYCSQFSEKAIQNFISFCPSLKTMHCKGIKLSEERLTHLKNQYSQLKFID